MIKGILSKQGYYPLTIYSRKFLPFTHK